MSARTAIVLGGGIGGVTAATHLRRLLPPDHRIVLIDKEPTFSLCMANLWLMTGERGDIGDGQRPLKALEGRGVEVVLGTIESIDPVARAIGTTAGRIEGDYLILALGADKNAAALPGFADSALNLYAAAGAVKLREALDRFENGRIVVLVSRTPFSCPAAPYEAALLIDSRLRAAGRRDGAEIALYTPEDLPMPVAGPHVGRELVRMLEDRGIEFHPEQIAMKIDPQRRKVLFELEDATFDVLVGVPPHRAPAVVSQSGLTDASGWVAVDPLSLATRFPGVYAIGDVTAVRLANGMFLPKAGVFADAQARTVAGSIAAAINGEGSASHYDGQGFCYVEVGDGMAAYGGGNFYGLPGPRITLEAPSARYRSEKEGLERSLLALWD